MKEKKLKIKKFRCESRKWGFLKLKDHLAA
jgi:hypothetical protein